jgi:hypothetical protein
LKNYRFFFFSDVKENKKKVTEMSSNINNEEHNPVTNLTMHPVRGILKTSKSTEQSQLENNEPMISSINDYSTTGMTRSESRR